MKVLIACEFSGVVRDAFRSSGHDAWSCDLLPDINNNNEFHIQDDVTNHLEKGWDLIIAHPPCTFLAVSGNRYYYNRPDLYIPAYEFAKMFMKYADKVCVENPVGRLSTLWRKPDQYIQPWQFGHGETKKTGLWLKNLPKLKPTKVVEGREQKVWKMPPSENRWMHRSITFKGVAEAMAEQWGKDN